MSSSAPNVVDELLREVTATRKAVAMILQRMVAVEEAVNAFTNSRQQQYEEEKVRRREATW